MKKVILLLSLSSFMTFANVPRSSVSTATGGGGVASVETGDASFMNPANLAHLKGRNFYSSFQKDLLALSLTENDKASYMPGAVSYFKDKELQMFALGLADFAFRNVAIGVSFTYWQTELDEQEKRKTSLNANAGVTWTPTENFGIAFAVENMLSPPDDFQRFKKLVPTSRVGLNYLFMDWFRWRLDFVTMKNNQWDNWIPQTGFESFINQWLILRLGVSQPPGLSESWAAGIGFDLPRFRIDYASEWNRDGKDENLHSVDLSIPFW